MGVLNGKWQERFNRRYATNVPAGRLPWNEFHGYHQASLRDLMDGSLNFKNAFDFHDPIARRASPAGFICVARPAFGSVIKN